MSKFCSAVFAFLLLCSASANAAFPDDFSDVVFVEGGTALTDYMNRMTVTADLTVEISGDDGRGGQNVILRSSKSSSWPAILGCCNANAWLFVKVGELWYAATWEFLRVGQTTKSTRAMVGPGHLRYPPLTNFSPQNGEIYGHMVAGITRNGLSAGKTNIAERSNIALHKFGFGPVTAQEAGIGGGDSESAI
jgi:hypothetical protein